MKSGATPYPMLYRCAICYQVGSTAAGINHLGNCSALIDDCYHVGGAAPAIKSNPTNKTCAHNPYWRGHYGTCMCCRAEVAEAELSAACAAAQDASDYILHKASRHDLNWREGHAIVERIRSIARIKCKP